MKNIKIAVWTLILGVFVFGIKTTFFESFKFENAKYDKVQGTVEHEKQFKMHQPHFDKNGNENFKVNEVPISSKDLLKQIHELKSRIDNIERKSFEKERSK